MTILSAGLCGDAPAGLDEHPEHELSVLTRLQAHAGSAVMIGHLLSDGCFSRVP